MSSESNSEWKLPPRQKATKLLLRWGTDHLGITSFNPINLESCTLTMDGEKIADGFVLLAYRLNGQKLEEGFGFPLRLVVPNKYAYKSTL